MAYSLPVRCTGWLSTETTRVSRLTANLPVRIVGSGWLAVGRADDAWMGTGCFVWNSDKLQLTKGISGRRTCKGAQPRARDPPQCQGVEHRTGKSRNEAKRWTGPPRPASIARAAVLISGAQWWCQCTLGRLSIGDIRSRVVNGGIDQRGAVQLGAAKSLESRSPIPLCASTGGDASAATANAVAETIADLIARLAILRLVPCSSVVRLYLCSTLALGPLQRCIRSLGDIAKDQIWDIVFSLHYESSERTWPAFSERPLKLCGIGYVLSLFEK